jgi:hypothetical protein
LRIQEVGMHGRLIMRSEVGRDLPPGHGSLQAVGGRRRPRAPWLKPLLGLLATAAALAAAIGFQPNF